MMTTQKESRFEGGEWGMIQSCVNIRAGEVKGAASSTQMGGMGCYLIYGQPSRNTQGTPHANTAPQEGVQCRRTTRGG